MVYITDKIKSLKLSGDIAVSDFDKKKSNIISEESTTVPMHIARIGEFKGYRDGEFELTQDIFNQCIANFYSEGNPLPVYRGHADVVGSSNGEEAPACGWILGLKTDDKGNLFALVELTEEIKEEIKAGKYKYTSIYMKSDEVHRETGESIGCRLVSLALTNQPFIDNLQAIKLSNKNPNENNIYLSKEIKSMKNTKKILQATEPLVQAEKAEEQVEKMQEGKVMAEVVDPMTMLEQAKNAIDPEMKIEDFVKTLLETFTKAHEEAKEEMAEEAVEIAEESTLAEPEAPKQEEIAIEENKEEKETVEASALTLSMNTVKSLDLALSTAKKEIESLKAELEKERTIVLSAIVDDAVSKGKILDNEKHIFIKLGKSNKELFDEMLSVRNIKPSIVLSRLVNNVDKLPEKTIDSKQMNLSEKERKMLAGAKIKV